VPLARASWIAVVAVCAIAVVLLAIGDYTGYAITVGAVGLAAAVNLLPDRRIGAARDESDRDAR
jgi:hypothetical protein